MHSPSIGCTLRQFEYQKQNQIQRQFCGAPALLSGPPTLPGPVHAKEKGVGQNIRMASSIVGWLCAHQFTDSHRSVEPPPSLAGRDLELEKAE